MGAAALTSEGICAAATDGGCIAVTAVGSMAGVAIWNVASGAFQYLPPAVLSEDPDKAAADHCIGVLSMC